MFAPADGPEYRLDLQYSDKHDEACMKFLSNTEDLSRLQPEYKLTGDNIQIIFYTTRLSEEEIDPELFKSGNILKDIDPKALIGLFLDNRFHG